MSRPTTSAIVSPARSRVVLAFAAIYVIWGTTYLAIRYAIETLPPFLMGSARFFIAGGMLFAWARFRGVPTPRPTYWKPAVAASLFLMVGESFTPRMLVAATIILGAVVLVTVGSVTDKRVPYSLLPKADSARI